MGKKPIVRISTTTASGIEPCGNPLTHIIHLPNKKVQAKQFFIAICVHFVISIVLGPITDYVGPIVGGSDSATLFVLDRAPWGW